MTRFWKVFPVFAGGFVLCLALAWQTASAEMLIVDSIDNIYLAGGNPGGGSGGPQTSPPVFAFPAGPGRTFTFSPTGATNCGGFPCITTGPDGRVGVDTSTGLAGGTPGSGTLSNIVYCCGGSLPLMGVFLANGLPGAAPATLDFSVIGYSFTELSPETGQVFFIGDGLTGTGSGQAQIFHAPMTATRLFLGIIDCCYGDNSGQYTVNFETQVASPVPEPATLLLLGSGLFGLSARAWRRSHRK